MNPQRKDIPATTCKTWLCATCNKLIGAESQESELVVMGQITKQTLYIPESRYWNGYTDAVYCCVKCSCVGHGVKLYVQTI